MSQRVIVLCLAMLFSTSVLANCPAMNAVKYGCVIINNQKHCSWSAAWYEGFPDSSAKPGDQAASFGRAYWSTANGTPPTPGHVGSTVCFYKSPYGNKIELVQNAWGGVVYPAGANWTDGVWDGHAGRQCTGSASECSFDYPPG